MSVNECVQTSDCTVLLESKCMPLENELVGKFEIPYFMMHDPPTNK